MLLLAPFLVPGAEPSPAGRPWVQLWGSGLLGSKPPLSPPLQEQPGQSRSAEKGELVP